MFQLDIVRSCLFDNTLVCLPTGLGKTFIAAVVMYNFYRWFPRVKIVFMAPTKPLVTQQMEGARRGVYSCSLMSLTVLLFSLLQHHGDPAVGNA